MKTLTPAEPPSETPPARIAYQMEQARILVGRLAAKCGGVISSAKVGEIADYYEDLALALRYVAEEKCAHTALGEDDSEDGRIAHKRVLS